MKSDAVTVEGAAGESLEDQKGQGTLEKVIFRFEHETPIDSYR
jgi:hypothetical protein